LENLGGDNMDDDRPEGDGMLDCEDMAAEQIVKGEELLMLLLMLQWLSKRACQWRCIHMKLLGAN